VPPENKPTPAEIATCRRYLAGRIASLPRLAAILVLGRIAHDSTLDALGLRKAAFPFRHGARHALGNGVVMFDSYHCSRHNTNTGRLTEAMFRAVVDSIKTHLSGGAMPG
jgi:uracil-DNA glycosylase